MSAASDNPHAVVTASMASLQPTDVELLNALLDNDEELAVERGTELAEAGPREGYANYSASKQAIARWVRRLDLVGAW